MRHLFWLLFALALLALPARAGTYKDADHAFSLDLPPGWTPMNAADVDAAAKDASADPDLHCYAGFNYGDQAVLLLSTAPYPDGITHTSFSLTQIQQAAAAFTGASIGEFHTAVHPASSLGAGAARQITCFTDPPGFIIDTQRPADNVREHSVGYFARDQIVFLHFFMTPADYPVVARTMNPLAASFQFNFGHALSARTTFDDPANYANLGVYSFVALLLLACAGIVYYLFRTRAY